MGRESPSCFEKYKRYLLLVKGIVKFFVALKVAHFDTRKLKRNEAVMLVEGSTSVYTV